MADDEQELQEPLNPMLAEWMKTHKLHPAFGQIGDLMRLGLELSLLADHVAAQVIQLAKRENRSIGANTTEMLVRLHVYSSSYQNKLKELHKH